MVKVRNAEVSDAAAIASLVSQLGYPSTSAEMFSRLTPLLADPRRAVIVADLSGRLLGVADACLERGIQHDDYARVIALVVDATARGQGVGAFLMHQIEEWGREHGADRVTLTTANHRGDAHKFYENIGYQCTGRRYIKRLSGDAR
jgi:GNAT superfamily N-acetyltransferase